MNAKRTEPRLHCYDRPMAGAYVPAAATTPEHLRAVFAAERERLAQAERPRRQRRTQRQQLASTAQGQLQLVA